LGRSYIAFSYYNAINESLSTISIQYVSFN